MYSTIDTNIRVINLLFSVATLPASLILVKRFWDNGTHDKWIRLLFIGMFAGISISIALTIFINMELLFFGKSANDILFAANIRNLIKNATLFTICWGFLYIDGR